MKKHISSFSLCDIDLTALFFVVLFCCFSCLTYAQSKTAQNAKANSTGTKASQASNQTSSKKENANYKLSSQRIKTIEEIVDKYKTEGLSDEETVKKINAEIGQKMPLIPTEPLLKDDDATIKKLAQKKAEKEYGSLGTITSKLDAEAKKKFPLYKIGDRITLDYSANSRVYSVTGMLTRIAQKSVTVDEKRVNLIDLPETERAKFDASTNRIIRERYIDKQTQIEKQKLAEAEQKAAAQLKKDYAQQNEKAGYIYDSKKKKWITAQDIIVLSLKETSKLVSEELDEEDFYASNYEEVRSEDNKNKIITGVAGVEFGSSPKRKDLSPSASRYKFALTERIKTDSSLYEGRILTAYYTPKSKKLFAISGIISVYKIDEIASLINEKYKCNMQITENLHKYDFTIEQTITYRGFVTVGDVSILIDGEAKRWPPELSGKAPGAYGELFNAKISICYTNSSLVKLYYDEYEQSDGYKEWEKTNQEEKIKKEQAEKERLKKEQEKHQKELDAI